MCRINLFALIIFLSVFHFRTDAQLLFSENFQSYTGFGSTLTGGWQTSGPGGFKVYIRSFPDSSNKVAEVPLSNNKTGDSLISPEFGPLGSSAILQFKSRLVEVFTGITATVGHAPTAGDQVSLLISTNGGNAYQTVQNLITGYPTTGTAMNNFSIPLNAWEGQTVRFKIKVSRTSGSWFPNFDDFSVANLTSTSPSEPTSTFRWYMSGSELVKILNEKEENGRFELIGLQGQRMMQQPVGHGQTEIRLKGIPSGVYIGRICSVSSGCSTQKIILN